jgi:F-type H+-transporting ATPase subunit b
VKRFKGHFRFIASVGGAALTVLAITAIVPVDALAAGESADWRPIFDLVMRWVNFLILAFIIFKFSRAPIKSFLENRKQEISSEIEALEAEKERIIADIERNQQKLADSRERLTRLKERIIAEGERNKQKIIRDAENESKLMIESAGQKINSRIHEAQAALRSELVDQATRMAMERLPSTMTEQDNQKYIDAFLSGTIEKQDHRERS